ncbi:ABC transporter permease [Candidatus Saccharibacteria bacterium]|nr:ABC transporter permease [Candidatus Saccharibacteria bacterium]
MNNRHSVALSILAYIAWRNLVTKKLRSCLTAVGVIIGVGSIFFLLSFGLGLRNFVTDEVVGNKSIKVIDVSTANSKLVKLDRDSIDRFAKLPHANETGVSYSFAAVLNRQGSEFDTVVYGIDQNYQRMAGLNLVAGRLLNNYDNRSVVVNQPVMESIGSDSKSVLGEKISLTVPLAKTGAKVNKINEEFTVVGVINSGSGRETFVPSFIFDVAGVKSYSQARVAVDSINNVKELRRQIESQGFETSSPSDTIEQINQVFKFLNFILIGFGMIGMIIAVLGMFNTLVISLLERTKEIGLMVALGARHRDMSRLFIFEAMFLSLLGAVAGIALALVLGWLTNLIMNGFAHRRGVLDSFSLFATPAWLFIILILLMVVVGLLVAYLPARRAKRIDPIDALRRE